MFINYRCVDRTLAKGELFFNPIEYIPFISSYPGMIRIQAGIVQIIAGVAFAALKIIHALLNDNLLTFKESWNGIAYSLHGLANMARGCIAVFPGINLSLFIFDHYIGRLNYRFEPMEKNFYPLNQCLI